jgi:hypothetical protein
MVRGRRPLSCGEGGFPRDYLAEAGLIRTFEFMAPA